MFLTCLSAAGPTTHELDGEGALIKQLESSTEASNSPENLKKSESPETPKRQDVPAVELDSKEITGNEANGGVPAQIHDDLVHHMPLD